ncbi:MAG: hypothetical protein U9Q03_04435 [Patescibacteria group bacterium]|nr:hypothetical protein [Patescibacteria group bacterium]
MSFDWPRSASEEIMEEMARNPDLADSMPWPEDRPDAVSRAWEDICDYLHASTKESDPFEMVTESFKCLCAVLVQTGTAPTMQDAAKQLTDRAMMRLHAMEGEYGSADNYVKRKSSGEVLVYALDRIQTKLLALQEKDDANLWIMLVDSANHLFFVLARRRMYEFDSFPGPGHEHV